MLNHRQGSKCFQGTAKCFEQRPYFSGMKKCIDLPDLGKGGPYSHAVVAGGLVFVSGQTGQGGNSFREQFQDAISRVEKILRASGSSLDRTVKVTVYLSDPSSFQEMNALFSERFKSAPPARTTVVTASPQRVSWWSLT